MNKHQMIYEAGVMAGEITRLRPGVRAAQSADGKGVPHLLWMMFQFRTLVSEMKIATWYGYLQCAMIYEGLSTLEAEKARNRKYNHADEPDMSYIETENAS